MHVKDSQIAYQAVMKHFESIVNIFNQLGVHEAVEWIEHCQAHNRTIEQGQVIAKFLKPELKLRAYLAVMAHEVLCDENEFDQFLLDLKRMANGHRAHFRFKSCYAKMNAVIKEVKSYYSEWTLIHKWYTAFIHFSQHSEIDDEVHVSRITSASSGIEEWVSRIISSSSCRLFYCCSCCFCFFSIATQTVQCASNAELM